MFTDNSWTTWSRSSPTASTASAPAGTRSGPSSPSTVRAKAKSTGKVLGIAAYDLSAAFDTLDHSRLLDKLHTLGSRGKENDWFKH